MSSYYLKMRENAAQNYFSERKPQKWDISQLPLQKQEPQRIFFRGTISYYQTLNPSDFKRCAAL